MLGIVFIKVRSKFHVSYQTQGNISEKLMVYIWNLTVQIVERYVPSPANTVEILAVRHVKQGIETVGFRTDLFNHCRIYIISVNMCKNEDLFLYFTMVFLAVTALSII